MNTSIGGKRNGGKSPESATWSDDVSIEQILVLAIVQGLTEFLPISSSAHLVIPSLVLGWPDQGLAFDIAVHVGTLVAVVIYYRRDLLNLARGCGDAVRYREPNATG